MKQDNQEQAISKWASIRAVTGAVYTGPENRKFVRIGKR